MNESKEETETPIKETSEKEHCSIATIEQVLMSNNIMEAEEAFAVRRWQGLRGNISMPVEEVSPLDAQKSSKAVETVEAFHISENNISEVTCDNAERSNHSLAVTRSSAVNIGMPIEKVFSHDVQESSEVLAAENALSIIDNEINEATYDFGKGSDISLSVTGFSAINITMPIEKVSPLDLRKSSEDETFRERKRKRSCENCADETVQLKNSYSVNEEESEDLTEPLIKCRRLLSIEDSSIPTNSNGEMGLKHPEGNVFEDHISSKHSLASKESCEDNINMPTETGPTLDVETSGHTSAVTGSPASNVSVSTAKVSSQDVRESSQAVPTEDAGNISENEISECNCVICDHWMEVTLSFPPYISMPVEKVSSTNEHESSDHEATVDTFKPLQMSDNDISEVTCNNGEMSEHSFVLMGSSTANTSMPTEKVSSLYVQESSQASQALANEDGDKSDENEVSECSCVICKVSDHLLAVKRSFASFISTPIDKVSSSESSVADKPSGNRGKNEFSECRKVSSLDVYEPAEARNGRQRKRKRTSEQNVDKSVSQSEDFLEPLCKSKRQCNIEEASAPAFSKEVLCGNEAVEENSNQSDSNHVSDSSKLQYYVHVNSEEDKVPAVSNDELCGNEAAEENSDQSDSNHVSASSKLQCDVPVNSEETSFPSVSKDELCSSEVVEDNSHQSDFSHVPASSKLSHYVNANSEEDTVSAVSRDELCGNESVKDNSHQSHSSHVFASSKLPYNVHDNSEKTVVSAISKDELCGNEAVEENSHQSNSSHVCASSLLPYNVHDNSEKTVVSAISKDELCGNEAVEDNSNQPDFSHVSASSKVPCDVPVNSEQMALNSVQNALPMCAKIKNEELPLSVGTVASDVDTPDTIGYVRYYLRTAYQLLFGATRHNPVVSVTQESSVHQPQESSTAQLSQSTRARRGRVNTVWNGEAFVPEVQKREQNAPYLRRLRPRRQ
ncbi:uncharacterized protein LOC144661924 isoform X2 [Oculina patagonica]